ncbi:MAG: Transcriptional regulator, TetR family, partial [Aeromicrobium sp.]|nr:Transcriptional regulator, TetR family [Aeromicrobium sp.]
ATIAAISDEGIHKVRLQDVSAVAGVSVGRIQYYFKTRENLIEQALHRYTMDSVNDLHSTTADVDDPWDALVQLVRAHRRRHDNEPKARVWIALVHGGMVNVRHLRMLNTISAEWRRLYRDMLLRGIRTGRFTPTAGVEEIVEIMVGLTDAFAVGQVSVALDHSDKLERVTELFLTMLAQTLNVTDRPA